MKKWLMILLIGLFVSKSYGKTCPPAKDLSPYYPPSGWSVLLPPVVDSKHYDFGAAVHSLNGGFYFKHIICIYEACPSFGCPNFKLISDEEYELPNSRMPPWDAKPVIKYTLVCFPPDHNPGACVFE